MSTRTLPPPTSATSTTTPFLSPSSPLPRRRQGPQTSVPGVPRSCQSPRKSVPANNDLVKVKVRVNVTLTPDTHFHARSRLRSQGSGLLLRSSKSRVQGFGSQERSSGGEFGSGAGRGRVSLSLRPLTSVESTHTLRFKHPDATTSNIQYISDHNRNCLTSCEFPNIPSLMLSSATKQSNLPRQEGGKVDTTRSTNSENQQESSFKQEAEVDEPLPPEKSPGRSEVGEFSSSPSLTPRPRSFQARETGQCAFEMGRENSVLMTSSPDTGAGEGRLLRRDRHAHARLFPPVNPFRSGREGSGMRQSGRGDSQKVVHSERYTPLTEQHQRAPSSSALLREATMYDLNDQGLVQRPLEGMLPSPDRKTHTRHCRRKPEQKIKDRVKRSPENNDCLLVVTPREKTANGEQRETRRQ